jgi:hypothetical protein
MKIIILLFLFFKVNSLLIFKSKKYNIKIKSHENEIYEIKSGSTIISYNLSSDNKNKIQKDINDKTNNKYLIKDDNIYLSLYNYSNNKEIISTCQIFVYVHDYENNLYGQYILESKEYKQMNMNSRLISFHETNPIFYCGFSYYQYKLDNINYDNNLFFDFIYKIQDNKPVYLKKIGYTKIQNYIPVYQYSSVFRYKDVYWNNSSKIIYYRDNFSYKIIYNC